MAPRGPVVVRREDVRAHARLGERLRDPREAVRLVEHALDSELEGHVIVDEQFNTPARKPYFRRRNRRGEAASAVGCREVTRGCAGARDKTAASGVDRPPGAGSSPAAEVDGAPVLTVRQLLRQGHVSDHLLLLQQVRPERAAWRF